MGPFERHKNSYRQPADQGYGRGPADLLIPPSLASLIPSCLFSLHNPGFSHRLRGYGHVKSHAVVSTPPSDHYIVGTGSALDSFLSSTLFYSSGMPDVIDSKGG